MRISNSSIYVPFERGVAEVIDQVDVAVELDVEIAARLRGVVASGGSAGGCM